MHAHIARCVYTPAYIHTRTCICTHASCMYMHMSVVSAVTRNARATHGQTPPSTQRARRGKGRRASARPRIVPTAGLGGATARGSATLAAVLSAPRGSSFPCSRGPSPCCSFLFRFHAGWTPASLSGCWPPPPPRRLRCGGAARQMERDLCAVRGLRESILAARLGKSLGRKTSRQCGSCPHADQHSLHAWVPRHCMHGHIADHLSATGARHKLARGDWGGETTKAASARRTRCARPVRSPAGHASEGSAAARPRPGTEGKHGTDAPGAATAPSARHAHSMRAAIGARLCSRERMRSGP